MVSLGKISAGGAAALSGDVAVLLPRLASTGLLSGSDAAKSLSITKQLTDDLAYIADRGDFTGLAAQMASVRGFYGPLGNRFPQFFGFLYEPTVARVYGQANPSEALQIVVRDSDNLGNRSLDALFGRTIVEAKHGVGSDEAKQRLLKQVKTYAAYANEGLADKLVFAVPDEATKTAIDSFLRNIADGGNDAIETILGNQFISYEIVASPWKD